MGYHWTIYSKISLESLKIRIKANVDFTNYGAWVNSAGIWDGVNFMIFNSFRAVSEAGKQALLVNHRFIGCSKYYNI